MGRGENAQALPRRIDSSSAAKSEPESLLRAFFFRLYAVLHDIAGLEENSLQDLAPFGLSTQKELEVHPEVLELLVLRVAHDVPRRTILLQRKALLIPPYRLGL